MWRLRTIDASARDATSMNKRRLLLLRKYLGTSCSSTLAYLAKCYKIAMWDVTGRRGTNARGGVE